MTRMCFAQRQVLALGGRVCDSGSDAASSASAAKPEHVSQSAQKRTTSQSKLDGVEDGGGAKGVSTSEDEVDRTGIVACTHVIAVDLKRSETMFLAILLGKPVPWRHATQ